MPEAATAPNPTASPTQSPGTIPGQTKAPAPVKPSGSAVPSSAGEIHVGIPTTTPAPPRPGSKKAEMQRAMEARFQTPTQTPTPGDQKPADPPKPPKPEEVKPPETIEPSETSKEGFPEEPERPNVDGLEDAEDGREPEPQKKDGKKPSPWKIAEEYKKRSAQLEKELADIKKNAVASEEAKALQERIAAAETRAKELEEEVRFTNYQKSDEFKKQYQEPYERAWKTAMDELKEVSIADENGQARAVDVEDMLQLVQLPLGKAREAANRMFGDFADDVMAHRKEIKRLFEVQTQAISEAKTKGAEREKAKFEEHQRQTQELVRSVAESWEQANEAIASDERYGKFFSVDPDDPKGSERLQKGFEMVDKAFKEDPMNPKLSKEERAAIIRRHAAVRNRAAAFGRLVTQNRSLEQRIDELTKELEDFKKSEPARSGSTPSTGTETQMSAKERMWREMESWVNRSK